jgi:hypothetical protein
MGKRRLAQASAATLVILTAALTLLVLSAPAAAAVSCEKRVLADWLEDGSIDGVYRLPCYQAAIEAMPNDLRDYSDATDAIQRSLAAAVVVVPKAAGGGGGAEPSPTAAPAVRVAGASASFPLPLLVLAGVIVMLAAAAVAMRVWHGPALGRARRRG